MVGEMEMCVLHPEMECRGLIKAKEVAEEVENFRRRNDASHKEFYDRLAVLERQNAVQNEQYKNIMDKLGSVSDSLTELMNGNKEFVEMLSPLKHRVEDLEKKYDAISGDVKAIKEKPVKRLDGILDKVLWFFIAAMLTVIAAKIGLN